MIHPPVYTDGKMRLYKKKTDVSSDFPLEYLEDTKIEIWYSELSVYDKMRYQMQQAGLEITRKIRIAECREINSTYMCKINGDMHQIYNVTHITNKNGFKELEITLTNPEKKMEVRYD